MATVALALRYLRSRRIAFVCIFSVAVGVMSLITLTSLMDGVQAFFRKSVQGVQADLWVSARSLPAREGEGHFEQVRRLLAEEVAARGGPVAALAPRDTAIAVLAPGRRPDPAERDRFETAVLLGVDYEHERHLIPMDRLLDDVEDPALAVPRGRRGNPLAGGEHPVIILGDSLARKLGVARPGTPGRPGRVHVLAGRVTQDEEGRPRFEGRGVSFVVGGAFTTGREDFDGQLAYVSRSVLHAIGAAPAGDAERIYVRLKEGAGLEAAAELLRTRHPGLRVVTWMEENRNYLTALQDQKRILVVILAFIVFVACAAILGLIAMLVMEKRRDIGILRSMGMGRGGVVAAFTLYGLLQAVIGSAVGVVLGLQVTAHLDGVISVLSDWTGVELLNEAVYKFKTVPTHTRPATVVTIVVAVFGGALVSSILPALRAAFLDPVRCLGDE